MKGSFFNEQNRIITLRENSYLGSHFFGDLKNWKVYDIENIILNLLSMNFELFEL